MTTVLSAVLLAMTGFQMVTPRLEVDVAFENTRMPPRLIRTLSAEAARVWAPYGVDVRTTGAPLLAHRGSVTMVVQFADGPRPDVSANSLGSITFNDDDPTTTITLYPFVAEGLLPTIEGERDWPAAYRETMLGRALGRALAHEIGHYLLRSREHAHVGLMRAQQSMLDLTTVTTGKLFLSVKEQAAVERTILSLFAAPAAQGPPIARR